MEPLYVDEGGGGTADCGPWPTGAVGIKNIVPVKRGPKADKSDCLAKKIFPWFSFPPSRMADPGLHWPYFTMSATGFLTRIAVPTYSDARARSAVASLQSFRILTNYIYIHIRSCYYHSHFLTLFHLSHV